MDIVNEKTRESRTQMVKIEYDYLPKYVENVSYKDIMNLNVEFYTQN